jgi:hypothetical protein
MLLRSELQYFPPVISFSTLLKYKDVDFCLYDPWVRQRFRNRMILAGANGLLVLSIPLEGGRNQKGIYRDIRIDHGGDWQKRHWRSLFSAYGKSPWYFQYADGLEALYRVREKFLVDWNLRCLEWTAGVLRLPEPGQWVASMNKGRSGQGPGKWEGVDTEVSSGPGPEQETGTDDAGSKGPGQELFDCSDMVVPSNFQDPSLGPFPRYSQVFEERIGFQPDLSILDLLLCCGPRSLDILLTHSGLYSATPKK